MMQQATTEERVTFLSELLKRLKSYVASLENNEMAGFQSNYETVRSTGLDAKMEVAMLGMNEPKNRYRNVLAFDHSRVILDDGQVGNYINANWIGGFMNSRRYIATQGPVPTTIVDFWRMVWQVKSELIIKVTREVEGGVLKCHRYWPDPNAEPPQKKVVLGQLTVEFMSADHSDAWIVRSFKVKKGNTERIIQMFSYEAWPDHGVPLTTREFLGFRKAVKKYSDRTTSPIVVHCSAGVGRTGTYITIDSCLDAVDSGRKSKDLDVDHVVSKARKARVFMVQTIGQYSFCYYALLDGIRDSLSALGGAIDSFAQADLAEAKKQHSKEDAEIAGVINGDADGLEATSEELKMAEHAWSSTVDTNYDIKKEMTSLESRFVSLLQSGKDVDLSKATSDQIRNLVRASKELSRQKKEAAERRLAEEKKAFEEAAAAEKAASAKQVKAKKASAAEKQALKFMKKMSK